MKRKNYEERIKRLEWWIALLIGIAIGLIIF